MEVFWFARLKDEQFRWLAFYLLFILGRNSFPSSGFWVRRILIVGKLSNIIAGQVSRKILPSEGKQKQQQQKKLQKKIERNEIYERTHCRCKIKINFTRHLEQGTWESNINIRRAWFAFMTFLDQAKHAFNKINYEVAQLFVCHEIMKSAVKLRAFDGVWKWRNGGDLMGTSQRFWWFFKVNKTEFDFILNLS